MIRTRSERSSQNLQGADVVADGVVGAAGEAPQGGCSQGEAHRLAADKTKEPSRTAVVAQLGKAAEVDEMVVGEIEDFVAAATRREVENAGAGAAADPGAPVELGAAVS